MNKWCTRYLISALAFWLYLGGLTACGFGDMKCMHII